MLAAAEIAAGNHEGLLFQDLSFTVQPGDRVGIVGPNGAGKSTLLQVLSGVRHPEEGQVVTDTTVGFLPQTPDFNTSVFEYMDESSGGVLGIGAELDRLYNDYPTDAKGQARLGNLQTRYEEQEGWGLSNRIAAMLDKLGAPANALEKRFGELSGGEQSRVLLAGQLLKNPGVLLLDEPTNNLDSDALTWLESYLSEYKGSVITVSHDRTFLDNTVSRIIEIAGTGDKPTVYQGGYTAYRDEAARALAKHLLDLQAQEKRVKRLDEAIAGLAGLGGKYQDLSHADFYRKKASKIDQRRKALEHRLERMRAQEDFLEKPEEKLSLPLHLSGKSRKGRRIVQVDDLSLSYPNGEPVVQDVSFRVGGQDRVAILGKNGAGKTTLLGAIAGRGNATATSGDVAVHGAFSYMSQTQTQEAVKNSGDSVTNWFKKNVGEIYESDAMSMLVWFGFQRHQLTQRVKTLSPGEVNKLALLGMTYSGNELLLLDEPTNHLDIDGLDVVENVLSEFKGTLMVVSHDRAFLGNIACNRALVVEGGRVREDTM